MIAGRAAARRAQKGTHQYNAAMDAQKARMKKEKDTKIATWYEQFDSDHTVRSSLRARGMPPCRATNLPSSAHPLPSAAGRACSVETSSRR